MDTSNKRSIGESKSRQKITRCPKCAGFLVYETDFDGEYFECLNCGNHLIISMKRGVLDNRTFKYPGSESSLKIADLAKTKKNSKAVLGFKVGYHQERKKAK